MIIVINISIISFCLLRLVSAVRIYMYIFIHKLKEISGCVFEHTKGLLVVEYTCIWNILTAAYLTDSRGGVFPHGLPTTDA